MTDVQLSSDALDLLANAAADPLFWPNVLAASESAWHGHVPFAHWLVAHARPRRIVELGTHYGISFAAFCEAAARTNLAADCVAIDNWEGDPHAGLYGEEVFGAINDFVATRHAGRARLMRCRFDDALDSFAPESIDLLHIDGLHTYEAVRHDWESWRPKLSPCAVVLFHDTAVQRDDFGVWRLWSELRQQYAGFEFTHWHGLGVLAPGKLVPAAVARLCRLTDQQEIERVQQRFAFFGEAARQHHLLATLQALADRTALMLREQELLEQQLSQSRAHAETAVAALQQMQNSRVWRLTAPLRRLLG